DLVAQRVHGAGLLRCHELGGDSAGAGGAAILVCVGVVWTDRLFGPGVFDRVEGVGYGPRRAFRRLGVVLAPARLSPYCRLGVMSAPMKLSNRRSRPAFQTGVDVL